MNYNYFFFFKLALKPLYIDQLMIATRSDKARRLVSCDFWFKHWRKKQWWITMKDYSMQLFQNQDLQGRRH